MRSRFSRRDLLGAACTAGVTTLAGCAPIGFSGGDPAALDGTWPMAHADVGNTGQARNAPAVGTSWVLRWSRSFDYNLPTPAVGDETVYVVTGNPGSLTALDRDGAERWQTHSRTHRHTPAVGEELVVVGGEDGLTALEKADGSVRWQLDDGPTNPPAIVDGTVYSWMGNTLCAVAASDGQYLWRDSFEQVQLPSLAVSADAVAACYETASGGGVVFLYDRDSGDRRAVTEVAETPQTPTFGAGYLTVPQDDGRVRAFDPTDGQSEWVIEAGGRHVALSKEAIYLSDNGVTACEVHTGETIWEWEPPYEAYSTSAVAVGDGDIFVGTGGRAALLYVVDQDTGETKLEYQHSGTQHTGTVRSPALAGQTVISSNTGGRVFALEFENSG